MANFTDRCKWIATQYKQRATCNDDRSGQVLRMKNIAKLYR